MKYSLLPLSMLLLSATAAHAGTPNYNPIRVDLGFIAAIAMGDVSGGGPGISLEVKHNLRDDLAIGGRFEADALIGTNPGATSASATAQWALLAKADYFFMEGGFRPFAGLGIGYYSVGSASAGGTGASASAAKGLGISPQIGFNAGILRLSALYHLLLAKDEVSVTVGQPQEISRNFLGIELGFTFGGGRKSKPAESVPVTQE